MATLSTRLGTSRRTRPRAASVALLVLTCAALVYALGVIIFGLVSLATQLSAGVIQPTMTWRSFNFSDNGDGHHGVVISGGGGSVLTSVTGASAGSTTLYVVATLLGLAVQAVLAVLAWRLLRRLREGRPFERAAWRELAVLSVVLLTCGVTSQVLEWFTQLAVLADTGGSSTMTAAFRFEPTTVTAGVALALMAVAFHTGERLQRDAAGLV